MYRFFNLIFNNKIYLLLNKSIQEIHFLMYGIRWPRSAEQHHN